MDTGWTVKGSQFESQYEEEYSLLHVVQIGPGAHSASYPEGIWGSFAGVKAAVEISTPLTSKLCRVQ
jgi:hypothetical protein